MFKTWVIFILETSLESEGMKTLPEVFKMVPKTPKLKQKVRKMNAKRFRIASGAPQRGHKSYRHPAEINSRKWASFL